MEREFVEYTEALELKELGFNEPCFGFYDDIDDDHPVSFIRIESLCDKLKSSITLAPLYRQAFRWLREKHEIEATTSCYYSKRLGVSYEEREYHCHIIRDGVTSKGPKYKTYEDAELVCLKKLIELVKNK